MRSARSASQRKAKAPGTSQPRRAQSQTPSRAASSSCLIAGNRNRQGEWIYHLAGKRYYDEARAEQMFCTEEEAVAAGYRRSRAG
jgi:hypothetical protein